MITVTKKFEFEAAHKLPEYAGACRNLHGHTFKLEVTVEKGSYTKNAPAGMIIDFTELKKIITNKVLSKLDHAYLNDIFPMPTSEIMVEWIAKELFAAGLVVERIRLYETSNSYAEWTR
jgi:6-pyruvoyltetrahydropterin/6-carboxytetrahydropterin synthase